MAGLFVFLVLAVGVVGVLALVGGSQDAVLPGRTSPSAGSSGAVDDTPDETDLRGDTARALLSDLTEALEHGSPADVRGLGAPQDRGAARELEALRANVRALRIADLSMRYVDEDGGRVTDDQQRTYGDRAWVADVQLGWRVRGFDTGVSQREVALTLVETKRGAAFVSARSDSGKAAPLWLLDRLEVRRTARSLVALAGSGDPGLFSGLADQAVVDVHKVLPGWRGRLVVEVPGDAAELGHVLGTTPGAYGGIAAVTTTADGTLTSGAPVHIFVNPQVFDPLGPRGSQIVMSHEATHVATGAAVSAMPTWLLEGFADYVALDHVDLPVSVTASQILASVRKDGPPSRLPGKTEFDPQSKALGASYESAWLACRLLGEKYGEKRLIAFYRAADRDGSTVGPFRDLLGSDQRAFTRNWRAYLRGLAG
ncbi:MAG: hypothetical protein ABIQ59_10765 [Nocardioidaceae bacterium]